MRQTQRKGDIGLTRAIASFTEIGWDVSLPITESATYDLIVDCSKHLHRVQVKYTSGKEVNLKKVHSNAQGYVVKKTLTGDYDWLFVYSPTLGEYLVQECLVGRTSLTVQDKYRLQLASWQSGLLQCS